MFKLFIFRKIKKLTAIMVLTALLVGPLSLIRPSFPRLKFMPIEAQDKLFTFYII